MAKSHRDEGLKPCAFNKKHNLIVPVELSYQEVVGFHVLCKTCGAFGPEADTEQGAIILWNERSDDA